MSSGIHKNKAYPLRLDDELMEDVRRIADIEERPISRQLERIVKEWLEINRDKYSEGRQ